MEQQIRQINLEDGMPTVRQALARLQLEVRLARRQGVWVLKIIHGFLHFRYQGSIFLLISHLQQCLHILISGCETLILFDRIFQILELLHGLIGLIGIVPETRFLHHTLQFFNP